jgi:hypothetical protein
MAKLQLKAGTTSYIAQVFAQDSSSTTGAGLAGLAFNTSSLTAYYHRDTDTTATAITLVTMTVGTFTSSGFKEIDATNMPGCYQLGLPNTALASGAKSVLVMLKGAANLAPLVLEIELTAVDNQSATAFVTGVNSLAPPTNWNLESIDGSGRVDVGKVGGTAQTAGDLKASISAILTTAMTESYSTDGSTKTCAQALYEIIAFLFEANISSTTLTAKKLDGSTSAMTFTLSDATNPVTITRAT